MTTIQSQPGVLAASRSGSHSTSAAVRYFYSGAAALMLVLAFIGFNRFYLEGGAYPNRPITPPIKWVVIAHGVSMTLWLVLLIVQPVLIVGRKHAWHMLMGKIGAVLAALILVLGIWVAVRSASVTPAEMKIWGLSPREFMSVPFISAWIFAGFVALDVYYRKKPQAHRPMMLLATLSAMSAAISRIDPLNALYAGTVWERVFGPFFWTLVLGVVLVAIRCAITRSVDRWFAGGMAALIALNAGIVAIGPTPAWAAFARLLLG
ncbi:MAG: hypothetical protein HEQ23_03015 [Tepidisphaera sp.]